MAEEAFLRVKKLTDETVIKVPRWQVQVPPQNVGKRWSVANPSQRVSSCMVKSRQADVEHRGKAKTALPKGTANNKAGSRVSASMVGVWHLRPSPVLFKRVHDDLVHLLGSTAHLLRGKRPRCMRKTCVFTKAQHLKMHKTVTKRRHLRNVSLDFRNNVGKLSRCVSVCTKRNTKDLDTVSNGPYGEIRYSR